jgi:hypothetical protein
MIARFFRHPVVRFSTGAALAVSAALFVSTGISGTAIADPDYTTTTSTSVPDAAQAAPASDFTAPDPVSAQVDARAKGVKIEVLSELTDSSTTWANPDGTFTTEADSAPVRVADASQPSGWRSLDYTLQQNADGTVSPKSSYYPITLSGQATAADVAKTGFVSLDKGSAGTVSLGWDGALPQPTLDGDTATYKNVEPNMDLVVTMLSTGFEQSFVFTAAPTAAELAIALPLVGSGTSASQGDGGAVTLQNAKNATLATVSEATMWDARVDPASGLPLDEVQVPLTPSVPVVAATIPDASNASQTSDSGTSATTTPPSAGSDTSTPAPTTVPGLSLAVPASFFADPSIVYPVTVDPTITVEPSDTYVRSDYPTTAYNSSTELDVGTYNGGASVGRAYMNFSDAGWENQTITAATLHLYEFHSYNCTASKMWVYTAGLETDSTTWDDQPSINTSYEGNATFSKGYSSSCDAGWESISLKNATQHDASKGDASVGYGLRADSETNDDSWKRFNSKNATSDQPYLDVTWDRAPATPTTPAVSPVATYSSANYTSTKTPSFTGSAADADGGTTDLTFEVDSNTTGTAVESCTTAMVTEATNASCTLASALTDGSTYYVRAEGNDGTVAGAWSPYTTFKVEAALPPTPSISCAGAPIDSWPTTPPTSPVSCTVSVTAPAAGQSPASELSTSVDGGKAVLYPVTVGSAGSTSATVSIAPGAHSVSVTSSAPSGASAENLYQFGYGAASMTSPSSGTETNDIVRVSAAGPPAGSSTVTAQLKWRPAGTTGSAWNTDSGAITPTAGGDGEVVNNYAWSTQSAITDTTTGTTVTLDPRQSASLEIELCFTYTPGGTTCTADVNNPLDILRVPHAFGDGYPTAAAGDGQVALWTGELDVNQTDVSVSTPAGSLSVSRTHDSFAQNATSGQASDPESALFGPGWTASFAGLGTGDTGDQVIDNTTVDGTITFTGSSLLPEIFAEPGGTKISAPNGTYVPQNPAAVASRDQLVVSASGTSQVLTVTASDGTETTWTPVSTAVPISWAPQSVVEPGAEGTETYTTDSLGRVTQILAPVPSGVGSCVGSGPSDLMPAGCSALTIDYDPGTTPTENADGSWNIPGQVSQIDYEAYDPTMSSEENYPVATYEYNSADELISVFHPQTETAHPAVTYSYISESGDTLLATLTNEGYATTTYNYSDISGVVRLQNVQRGAAASGGSTSTQSAYVYGITPSTAGLPDFTSSTIGEWGEETAPTDGYAVFGADYAGNIDTDVPSTLVAEGTWVSTDWRHADLSYTDGEGYDVNDAQYGAGEWLRDYTQYDETTDADAGTAIGSLDADQIDTAVATNEGSEALQNETVTRYNAAGTLVTDAWSAPFVAQIPSGSGYITETVRTHTHYTYDQHAPSPDLNSAGVPYDLVTEVTVGASTTASATTDPTVTLPADLTTTSDTQSCYTPVAFSSGHLVCNDSGSPGATSGWTLGEPTEVTTVMPGGGANNITTGTVYDAQGDAIQSIAAESNGADAGTTDTIAYTAGTNPSDSACGLAPPMGRDAVCLRTRSSTDGS